MSRRHRWEAEGRRLRWLWKAEGCDSALQFAVKMNWLQSAMNQFETGLRPVPLHKLRALSQRVVGFDVEWLWSGDTRGLSFDLRQRLEAAQAKEEAGEESARKR